MRRAGSLDEKTLASLREEWKVEQVFESTGIEGNQLDLSETRLAITRGITISGKPAKDSVEARNMKAALDFLEELARDSKALVPRDVRDIQSKVLGDEPGAGKYRSGEVRISGSSHVPPPAAAVDAALRDAFEWLSNAKDCPPPLAAAVMHAWLTHIHPFSDGNGRSARALMNLILVRGGFPIVLVRRKDRNRYYDALAASDDFDIAPLVALLVQRSRDSLRQIKRVRASATGLTDEILKIQRQLEEQYETWNSAMHLLLRSIQEAAGRVRDESSGNISINVRDYSQVTAEDYLALLRRDASGNGWLASLRGHGYTRRAEVLLWVGFQSNELSTRLPKDRGPSVYFSEQDPDRARPFRPIAEDRPFALREIGWDGGHYWLREGSARREKITKQTADQLASRVLGDFLKNYLQ
ncbi:MAG: Fic family protein [Solirubrobacteraceae bacterium]